MNCGPSPSASPGGPIQWLNGTENQVIYYLKEKKNPIFVFYISFQRYAETSFGILFRIPTTPGSGTDALMDHSLILIWMEKGMPCI